MTTRKNKIICPWCGYEKRRKWADKFWQLTSREYASEKVDTTCDLCGKGFEVRAEECIYFKTKKVDA